MQRILIVEDDIEIQDMLRNHLTDAGYEVVIAEDGVTGIAKFDDTINLVLLDIMLPKIDGYGVCEVIRQRSQVPIIMLTALSDEENQIKGFEQQIDDYIPKPFNPLELVARVKAQIRRYTQYNDGGRDTGDVIDFGGLVLDRTSHECIYNEVPLTLTPIEFDILWLLCENRGKVISSEELFEKVWHEKYYKNSNNTVMVHIRHLREKMNGPTGKSDFIKTVWGVGDKVEE